MSTCKHLDKSGVPSSNPLVWLADQDIITRRQVEHPCDPINYRDQIGSAASKVPLSTTFVANHVLYSAKSFNKRDCKVWDWYDQQNQYHGNIC